MEIKDTILELRKSLNLSQTEFSQKLLVSRQAVSRWENGDTVPNIDTLKLIAKTFDVSVDYLLGTSARQCQSCGMVLEQVSDKGTERDGNKSEEYCAHCYQHGEFTHDITVEEMIEANLKDLDEWNKSVGLQLTEQEARTALLNYLPSLKRWKEKSNIEHTL